uniref:P43 5S RNA-binding protein n=2 Tax=Lepisosteus oculatus TaxID=7918 RepID=W5N536_LEPOC
EMDLLSAAVDAMPRQQLFNCGHPACGAAFTREWRLREHQTVHTGERPLACDIPGCGLRFSRKAHLRRHQLKHTGTKSFSCTHFGCSQSFYSSDNLKRHVQYAHGDKDSYFKCTSENCDKTFRKRKAYRIHLNEHNPTLAFRCQKDGCGMTFETRAALKAHQKTHAGYPCRDSSCPVVAPTWGKLCKHMATHPGKYLCPLCPAEFKTRQSLRRHKRSHTREKPVLACPNEGCAASFTTAFNLQHHIRKEHLKLFKYRCYYPDCPRVFAMRESLTRHVVHHDPEGRVKLVQQRSSRKWQKRRGGGGQRRALLVEEDLSRLFALRLRFPGRGKVEADLSGLFNERKIPHHVEPEVSLRELFDLKPNRVVNATP